MQRTKLLKIPFAELLVAGLVILLPLVNSSDLMFGIQTAKSFGFFYGLLVLVGVWPFSLIFLSDKLCDKSWQVVELDEMFNIVLEMGVGIESVVFPMIRKDIVTLRKK